MPSVAPNSARPATNRWWIAFRSLRASQWSHFLALPLAGQGAGLLTSPGASLQASLHGALVAAGCLAWAYGLNAITDRHQDVSSDKNPLVAVAPGPELTTLLGFCLLATLALASHMGGWTFSAALVSLTAGTLYSAGPRFKARVGMGTVVNALIFAPLPLVGAPWGAWSWAPLAALVAVFVALLCHNQLLHELADAAEDAPAGVHTTGARLGVGATAWLGVVLAALALALALPGQGPGLAVSAAVALLVSCLWLIRARGGDAATLRRSHRLLAVGCGALLMVVALLGSV